MKSFKQFITEGKYDGLKKELLDSEGVGNYIFNLQQLKNKYKFDKSHLVGNKVVLKFNPLYRPNAYHVPDSMYLDIFNWEKNFKGYNSDGNVGYNLSYAENGAKVIDVVVPDDSELFTKNVEIKFDNTETDRFKKNPERCIPILTITFPFFKARLVNLSSY